MSGNEQIETFDQHFKNGTITRFSFNIGGLGLVKLYFSMKTRDYTADFEIISNSRSYCQNKAAEIVNKLMN